MERKIYTFEECMIILEEIMKDNKDVLVRLKEKDTYTIEDFLASFEHNENTEKERRARK